LRVVPREELERLESMEREHFIKAFGEPVDFFGRRVPFGDVVTVVSLGIAVLALAFEVARALVFE
jgi:hypothetical protein